MNNISTLYGVILSAGKGSRLQGKIKALLKIGNKTFIEKIISNFRKFKIKNITIVLGYKAHLVKKYLKEKKIIKRQMSLNPALSGKTFTPPLHAGVGFRKSGVNVLVNRNYNSQQLTSLKLAVKNLPSHCAGIIFTPVDHPMVKLSTYKKLLSSWKKNKDKICLPSYNYRKGHPAIFPKEMFEKILTESVSGGARGLIKKYPKKVKYIVVNDPGTVNDFDSIGDFQKYGHEKPGIGIPAKKI